MSRSIGNMVGGSKLASGISDGINTLKFTADGDLLLSSASTSSAALLPFAVNVAMPLETKNIFKLTVSGDCTIENPTIQKGGTWYLYVKQDGIGGHGVGFGSAYEVAQGSVLTHANAVTLVTIVSAGDGVYDVSMTSVATR